MANGREPARIDDMMMGQLQANISNIGREIHEIKEEQKRQSVLLAAYPATCAEHRSTMREELHEQIRKATTKTVVWTAGIILTVATILSIVVFA